MPAYTGKGIRGSDGSQVYIFGYPLPNTLTDETGNLPGPWSIIDETSLFNVSSLTENHEVVTALYESPSEIPSATTYVADWYRNRDNAIIFSKPINLPDPPAGYVWSPGYTIAWWIGWPAEDAYFDNPQYREIQENGDYHVIISASGGQSFSQSVSFSVTGMPASTAIRNETGSSYDWVVNLSNYFTSSNYIRAGICSSPVTDGQSAPPSGIIATDTPANDGGCAASGHVTGSAGTVYGFAQAASGLYYQAGSVQRIPGRPTGLNVTVSGNAPNATVTATWDPIPGASGYNWGYRNPGTSGSIVSGKVTGTTTKTVTISTAGTYEWYVSGYNSNGVGFESRYSFTVSAPPKPGPISGLTVTVTGYDPADITATWNAPTTGGSVTAYDWDYTGASSNSGAVTTTSKTVYGVGPAGLYDFHVTPYNAGGDGPTATFSFAVDTSPNPPDGTPSFTSLVGGHKQITAQWTSVTGATSYDVYANSYSGNGWVLKGSPTGTSLTFPADFEYTSYGVRVIPKNSMGSGGTAESTVMTLDDTAPVINSVSVVTTTATTVTFNVSASDQQPTFGNASGVSTYRWYRSTTAGSFSSYNTVSDPTYTATGLVADTTYYFRVYAYDAGGNASAYVDRSAVTTSSRPENWAWFTPKTSGQDFNITDDEWNAFLVRVNDFREYKGMARVTFPAYNTGTDFTADAYNTAANHVNLISGRSKFQYVTGDEILASSINKLRDDLNSTV